MSPAAAETPLRPWQRLGVRLGALFAAVTLLGVGLGGLLVYERHQRDVEETVGSQILNIARIGALLVDARLLGERLDGAGSSAPARLTATLARIRDEALLTTPVTLLAGVDAEATRARVVASSDGPGPAEAIEIAPGLVEPLRWTREDGVARYTRLHRAEGGARISAVAPVLDGSGRPVAFLRVDYDADIYLDRLHALRRTILEASVASGLGALLVGLLFARRLTRPLAALTAGVARVAAGDLSREIAVASRDEIGRLTRAFNHMLEGLRQRDFVRAAFGRYVSPEVAQALLDSPDGLRLGGEKREVTILTSDLRGYTRFAEHGDPAQVMEILNDYLGRMAEIVIEHRGTVNEFIGDAVFAIFGAPIAFPDHAERAAAAALAMQEAMTELNGRLAARGLPRFEMGIGINTGEAVVGNIGSEQRAKYSVVGNAVNLAARVESATVGGQVLVSESTWAAIRELAEVGDPLAVEVKGISRPLTLYELRGLRGRFARRLPEVAAPAGVPVAVPVRCQVIDGKVVREEIVRGEIQRLAPEEMDARLDQPLAPLTNVRLRLAGPGGEACDLLGKVVPGAAAGLTRIRLTAVGPEDRQALEALTRAAAPVAAGTRPG